MASAPAEPNILLVITDQHRADWLGLHSSVPVRTPTIDSLAQDGTYFQNAICPSPICGPSRSCLASGYEYDRCGVPWNGDFPSHQATLYQRARDEAGYAVLGIGDLDLHMDSPTWGLKGTYMLDSLGFTDGVEIPGKFQMVATYETDLRQGAAFDDEGQTVVELDETTTIPSNIDPGPRQPSNAYLAMLEERGLLEDYVTDIQNRSHFQTTRPSPIPQEAYVDDWVGQQAVDHLRELPADHPWFMTVNFVGPHPPVDVTETMYEWYRSPDIEFPDPVNPADDLPLEQHQEIRRNYAAMIENIDRWIGRILSIVDEREERGETLVIVTSDHGELLGDHGAWEKKSPRWPSVAVPLVVSGPGVDRRDPVEEPVTTLDLHATILDYLAIDPGPVDSQTLRPVLSGASDTTRPIVTTGLDPWRMAYDGRFSLILGFDRDRDPRISNHLSNWFADTHPDDRSAARQSLLNRTDPILLDHRTDPDERRNVASEHPAVVDRLQDFIRTNCELPIESFDSPN